MISVTFIAYDGAARTVTAEPAGSLMALALANGIPGIHGDCGGSLACGTCQVYLPPQWYAHAGDPSALESSLLEVSTNSAAYSRLGCQVQLDQQLDGLVVHTPEQQGI